METGPIGALQKRLRQKKIDAFLVSQPQNRRYLSGYKAEDTSIAESAGYLLIPARGRPLLLTDFRFRQQAEEEAGGFKVVLYRKGLLHLLTTLIPKQGIKSLAFEGQYFLYTAAIKLIEQMEKSGGKALPTRGLIEDLRVVKTAEEIELVTRSVRLNEKVFRIVYREMRPGRTEKEIALRIETLMQQMGADGPSFPPIVASGPNGAMPHAMPTDRPIQEGEPIIVDMGCIVEGYCSDMTRTVVLGKADEQTLFFLRLVRKAQKKGMAGIQAGMTCREVDGMARKVISQAGHGPLFGHGLGHGVGLAVHEGPSLNKRSRSKLRPGMIVTVEPGVYLPGWGGIRLENMVVVEENGCRNLNTDETWLDN